MQYGVCLFFHHHLLYVLTPMQTVFHLRELPAQSLLYRRDCHGDVLRDEVVRLLAREFERGNIRIPGFYPEWILTSPLTRLFGFCCSRLQRW